MADDHRRAAAGRKNFGEIRRSYRPRAHTGILPDMVPSAQSFTTQDGGTGPEDLLLVKRALRGETEAVDGILVRLSCIARFVYRINESLGYGLLPQHLEDVVQQVYTTVWPRLGDYEGSAALGELGLRVSVATACAPKRASGPRSVKTMTMVFDELDQGAAEAPAPEQSIVRSEGVDAVRAELERLQPVERDVVRLRHLEGWSFERIARVHGLPPSTVKDRCYRALMKLKGRLRQRDVSA